MCMDLADPVSSGKYSRTCVSTAPVVEPIVMSFTGPLNGCTIVATASVVTSCSSSADCPGSVASMCCAMAVISSPSAQPAPFGGWAPTPCRRGFACPYLRRRCCFFGHLPEEVAAESGPSCAWPRCRRDSFSGRAVRAGYTTGTSRGADRGCANAQDRGRRRGCFAARPTGACAEFRCGIDRVGASAPDSGTNRGWASSCPTRARAESYAGADRGCLCATNHRGQLAGRTTGACAKSYARTDCGAPCASDLGGARVSQNMEAYAGRVRDIPLERVQNRSFVRPTRVFVDLLPLHSASKPYTGKVFTVNLRHHRDDQAFSDCVEFIRGLDKHNMPRLGDVMVPPHQITKISLFEVKSQAAANEPLNRFHQRYSGRSSRSKLKR